MSRILKRISEQAGFKFHPKCASMQYTHVCFVDDILLCCKREFNSIHLILRGFKLFFESSGMQVNVYKSVIYCSGMKDDEIQRALHRSGFVRGHQPFKYLGVPICPRKITTAEHENLTEKMVARIRM